jgi:hypothetical protein
MPARVRFFLGMGPPALAAIIDARFGASDSSTRLEAA